jgi:hypothetical protein
MAQKVISNKILFWKISVIALGLTSLSTWVLHFGDFWTSYVLDITGPAMGYILIRGQYNSKNSAFLFFKFSPDLAALIIIGICIIIETSQYFNLYNAYFDPYDYLAYCSGVLFYYCIDKWLLK